MEKEYCLTYPHAGEYYIAFEFLFSSLGYKIISPPKTNQETLNIGVKLAPSQACLPFKVTLGNFIQGMEKGANVAMMIGGRTGICRLAYYSELYKKIITDNGYKVEFINLKLKKEFWVSVKGHFPDLKFSKFINICYLFFIKMKTYELIKEKYLLCHPYETETEKGECGKLRKELMTKLKEANTNKQLKLLKKETLQKFSKYKEKKDVVKIALVGEFYLLIDQFSTLNIEDIISDMGVVVKTTNSFTDFFIGSVKFVRFLDKFIPTYRNKINRLAKPYIDRPIGGHALQSVGETVNMAKQNFDGVIHIYPFSCMPEVVAKPLVEIAGKNHKIPVMSLCFDEHTGIAGLQTRLEAFIDMIKKK